MGLIDYIEWALGTQGETEEEGQECVSLLMPSQPVEKTSNSADEAAGENQTSESTEVKKTALTHVVPIPVWRVRRDDETDGVTSAEETVQREVQAQPEEPEKAQGESWMEVAKDLHLLSGMPLSADIGSKTEGSGMLRQRGESDQLLARNGTSLPKTPVTSSPSDSAAAIYRQVTALGNAAGYRKRNSSLTVQEKGDQGEFVDAAALDRAFQRDARRYNGGFTLY